MPKRAPEMSAIEVRRLTRPGLHAVGGVAGLHLCVRTATARSWILRIRIGARRRDIGLGAFPGVSLEQARARAREVREMAWQGTDPVATLRARQDALKAAEAGRLTFAEAAEAAWKARAQEFRNPKHARQWKSTLDVHAGPVIGELPVEKVAVEHVVKILEPIWTEKTETASRLRGRIEAVLSWATAAGYRTGDNPARWKGCLEHVLPRAGKLRRVQHHAALSVDGIPAFMAALRKRPGMGARALEFAILTAARSGEVRGATWGEIDLDARTWTIAGERMKAGRMHVAPLSDDAVALLRALPRLHGTDLVFPSRRMAPVSDMTLSAVCRRMKVEAVPHGFRSTFKDWARTRTAYPDEVSELQLAHVASDVTRAAYARDALLDQRARMLRDWARFCREGAGVGGQVRAIRENVA